MQRYSKIEYSIHTKNVGSEIDQLFYGFVSFPIPPASSTLIIIGRELGGLSTTLNGMLLAPGGQAASPDEDSRALKRLSPVRLLEH